MERYKKGDYVKLASCNGSVSGLDTIGVYQILCDVPALGEQKDSYYMFYSGKGEGSKCVCGYGNRWVIHNDDIETIKGEIKTIKNMSLIDKASLFFKGEPEKSFIKAGVLDSSEMPTADGIKLFVAWSLKQKDVGNLFKTDVIDPILADDKKE